MKTGQSRASSVLLTVAVLVWLCIRPVVRTVDDALTWED